jgi:hypothetical protein
MIRSPLRFVLVLVTLTLTLSPLALAQAPGGGGPSGAPPAGSPDGAPPGPPPGAAAASTKVAQVEGDWSFDLVTTGTASSATITYYSGKSASIVVVPSVLGGAKVTTIAAQAFGHHGEIGAVYVPDSVTTVADWGFYDLNEALVISFGNPEVNLDPAAFQSSGNAVLYLPAGTKQTKAGGKAVVTAGTSSLKVAVVNLGSAAVAGGNYLNVAASKYPLTTKAVTDLARGASGQASDVVVAGAQVTFGGSAYKASTPTATVAAALAKDVKVADLNQSFQVLTAAQASALNQALASDASYQAVKFRFDYRAGAYLNGSLVTLDPAVKTFDAKTGLVVAKDPQTGLLPSTGAGAYKYVSARDTDGDGDIDVVYYSPFGLTYSYNATTIASPNANLNGLKARDTMNPLYLSFANAVIAARGEGTTVNHASVTADTGTNGDKLGAAADQERSLVWAHDYASVAIDELHGISTSVGNWAKMSKVAGLSSYNVEIVMEWGMNALLYATDGGQVRVGTATGPRSTLKANGDGANGVVAGGTGTKSGQPGAPGATSSVTLVNADLALEGWNNHVADVVYGGYASLNNVTATTGKAGSYAVGQASALANDFGNGVVDAVDFHTTVYGNRSAGAYVIGGGVITAKNSSFVSKMDSGLVIASGGTFQVTDSQATGQIGLRNRGGINADSKSTLTRVTLAADKDTQGYVTGARAARAVAAWKAASGSSVLIHALMSDPQATLGSLTSAYGLSADKAATLYAALGQVAGRTYTAATPLRNSVLDNTYYNYSAGAYTGTTDFADVPYLTSGSAFGGLVSSTLEFEASGVQLLLDQSTVKNTASPDYCYLLASEAGSAPVVTFRKTDAQGLIWNEGTVQRAVEGRPGDRSSQTTVAFEASTFTGSFADGSSGLWDVKGLTYTDGTGKTVSRNGNYYGAQANQGTSASFDAASAWVVTHDSYLGKLSLAGGARVSAPEGYQLTLTVDGKVTPLKAGTYTGNVVVSVTAKKGN